MGTRSKDTIKAMITKDMLDIHNRSMEVKKSLDDNLEDTLDYLHALIAQIPQSASGPLITKTPKVLKKKVIQHIETIPEDDVVTINNTISNSIDMHVKVENKDIKTESAEETIIGRTKREASRKAANNIRQQSLEQTILKKKKRESRTKRKKSGRSSSDEESTQGPTKHSKIEESILREDIPKKAVNSNTQDQPSIIETTIQQEPIETPKKSSMTIRTSSRKRTFSQSENVSNKKSDIIENTFITAAVHDIEEPSMYEDAIEKPMPIMNSTMNSNSTFTIQKMMDATVVLETLSAIKLNTTVTINKNIGNSVEKNNAEKIAQPKPEFKSPRLSMLASPSSKTLQDRLQQLKEDMANKEFDDLLTEDESSFEVKELKQNVKKQENKKRRKKTTKPIITLSDNEMSPVKPALKEMNAGTMHQEIKNTYKSNALFSPYAKESVKKRVEAFEQAGMNSPKLTVDIDAPIRVTRTKTRAIAAAQEETSKNTKATEKTIVYKLARKSLAKAKQISLGKQSKDIEKENKVQTEQKVHTEKVNQKQQQKTTPLAKTKIQLPMSASRVQHTTLNNQINANHMKPLSVTRTNIITSVESFLHPPKSVNKRNSIDKIEEKKRKLNEDAKKKREEALRLLTEEKRRKRQQKELRNKLAREAKEKQDIEKRQKIEKEREEKARLAQQMQEKQREEIERKRLAQLQRVQEKEEKRKQEEQVRLQRLQEQEEAERILAEQRRREQEAEKRKEAEAKAQQQTAAEAMKVKNQMLMTKYGNKHHGPTNYVLDSEPDDDESDDESRPKHVIPYWAHPQVRKAQLAMQRYIPENAVFRFFDSKKCTPDLTELFQGIDRRRLIRTSSAIWKTPPRYSMMQDE